MGKTEVQPAWCLYLFVDILSYDGCLQTINFMYIQVSFDTKLLDRI